MNKKSEIYWLKIAIYLFLFSIKFEEYGVGDMLGNFPKKVRKRKEKKKEAYRENNK